MIKQKYFLALVCHHHTIASKQLYALAESLGFKRQHTSQQLNICAARGLVDKRNIDGKTHYQANAKTHHYLSEKTHVSLHKRWPTTRHAA